MCHYDIMWKESNLRTGGTNLVAGKIERVERFWTVKRHFSLFSSLLPLTVSVSLRSWSESFNERFHQMTSIMRCEKVESLFQKVASENFFSSVFLFVCQSAESECENPVDDDYDDTKEKSCSLHTDLRNFLFPIHSFLLLRPIIPLIP